MEGAGKELITGAGSDVDTNLVPQSSEVVAEFHGVPGQVGVSSYYNCHRLAQKNTKVRSYLLRGLIYCTSCGASYVGVTFTRRNKEYSNYVCGKRWKPGPNGHKCGSSTLVAAPQENAVFTAVVDFLHSPAGFESEMQRRRSISAETAESMRRELASLRQQQKEEQDAEARAFRVATRHEVSDMVFDQEIGLIRTKQRWIEEQLERVETQLNDLERPSFSPKAIARLRHRLDARLTGATFDDKRYVLEAVGTKVIVQADGSWELELQVPQSDAEAAEEFQIVNSRPRSNYTVIHI